MISIKDLRDWIATKITGTIYPQFTDMNNPENIGVYLRDTGDKSQAMKSLSDHELRYYKAIVHWSTNIGTAEAKAKELANLFNNKTETINGKSCIFTLERQPTCLGRTDKLIWEYLVLFRIIEED